MAFGTGMQAQNIDKRVTEEGLGNSDAVMERGILLPLHHGMTDSMFQRLHSEIENFLGNF